MNQNTAPQPEYKITVRNSRLASMFLDLEPEGWSWELKPGEAVEIIFKKQEDFWATEPLMFTERGATFWGVFPAVVVLVTDDERSELLRVPR